jgi:hypothetical protein
MRCLPIDVTLYAMRIRCCGNVFQQFFFQQRRLLCCHGNVLSEAPPSRWADCNFQVSCHNILTAVVKKSSVFVDITPCSQLKVSLRFGRKFHLHFQHFLPHAFTLVPCLAYSLNLKMEATCSSETSIDFQRTTRRCIQGDITCHMVIK